MLLYRLLLSLFALVSLTRGHAWARLGGIAGPAHGDKPYIWLHGASNGELASVRPVLEHLVDTRKDLHWLVTSNTETGTALVEGWKMPRVEARLAPLDLAWITRPMMRRWNIQAHIALESELWPHRILACPGPTLFLGARMSDSTAKSWARLGQLAPRVLGQVAFASAQDSATRDHLVSLGLPAAHAAPIVDLKALYSAPDMSPDADLLSAFARDKTWLAASTHEGEEEIILSAHKRALAQDPEQRLILAPRHPRRSEEIKTLAAQMQLDLAQRSLGQAPEAQVYLADTMGEMALWYQLAGRVFIGGSLTDRGGHTPYEPAAFGAALIHGTDTRNFRAAYTRLEQADASIEIVTTDELLDALNRLSSPHAQRTAGKAAADALKTDIDLDEFCGAIEKILTRDARPLSR